jgi:hypothetical protein
MAHACVISPTRAVLESPAKSLDSSTFVIRADVVDSVRDASGQAELLTLRIKEALKGELPASERLLLKNSLSSDCSQHFEPGREYLIFGRPQSDRTPDMYTLVGITGADINIVLDKLQK